MRFGDAFFDAPVKPWIGEAIDLVNADLAGYENVTGVVWDIRGNNGGAQEYGLGLFASLGDVPGGLGNCYARIPQSEPAAFDTSAPDYPFPFDFLIDEPQLPTLSFTGNHALVTDGLTYSAADWMAHRADLLGIPVIGHHASGAFGYTAGATFQFVRTEAVEGVHPGIDAYVSGAYCEDPEGNPIEGLSPLSMTVDLDAADLAAGIDTQIEAAVALVLQ